MNGIEFSTEDGVTLEGELRVPEGSPLAPAVLCHPHPSHGGSKDHPLLWNIRNELAARGFAVLSFNFRGVMGSGGSYGGGVKELMDVKAAVGRVRAEMDAPVFLCGWSFGANVGLRAAIGDDRIGALALIGLSLADTSLELPSLPRPEELKALDRPVLFLSGAADQFSPAPELRTLARRIRRATVRILDDTDHFFWKREAEAARVVAEFAEEASSPSG